MDLGYTFIIFLFSFGFGFIFGKIALTYDLLVGNDSPFGRTPLKIGTKFYYIVPEGEYNHLIADFDDEYQKVIDRMKIRTEILDKTE